MPARRVVRRRRGFGRRGLLAGTLTLLVLLIAGGSYLAYQSTLPTTFTTNFKNGQKDVPIDGRVLLAFTRSVPLSNVKAAFSISPAVDGSIDALSGSSQYAWTPAKPLAELTTYTVTLKPTRDSGNRPIKGSRWTFTTIIVPHVTSITGPGGVLLQSGMEIDPGWPVTLTFNDVMQPATVKILAGTAAATLSWSADDRSVTVVTKGLASGPLTILMSAGARDQTGHLVPATFAMQTGIYYHDRESTTPLRYPALIQIPNDENAVDQNGLQAANMVFEYLAEGGITRLTAVYQNVPSLIGPMRSARFVSLKLGRHYRGLLFQSGESQATAARERQDPTPQFFDTIGYQFRTSARIAPDNLMITGAKVKAAEDNYFSSIASFTLPQQRPTMPAGSGASSVSVGEHYSVYSYDPVTGTYSKTEAGHLYKDASLGSVLHIEMLIVLHTNEQLLDVGDGHGSHIHDFDLDTGGAIQVYYKGQGYQGTWKSTDSHGPLTFTLSSGQPLTLPPGLVWIDITA